MPRAATVVEAWPAVQSTLYGSSGAAQPLPAGLEVDGCRLKVSYNDGTTEVISAAQEPPSAFEEAADFLVIPAYLGMIALASTPDGGGSDGGARFRKAKEELEEFKAESGKGEGEPPKSGEFWGASDESDDGDQSVRSHLKFGKNGRITGHGRDGVDGSYRIADGHWRVGKHAFNKDKVLLAWKEQYDEGFEAICFGTYNRKTGKIEGRFASSRHVSGAFDLAMKPSVF